MTTDLQQYAARSIFIALRDYSPNATLIGGKLNPATLAPDSLKAVALYCMGEYGDAIVNDASNSSSTDEEMESIVSLAIAMLGSLNTVDLIREYSLTTLAKLSGRFPSASALGARIEECIAKFSTSTSIEVQQRACEYSSILSKFNIDTREKLVDKMPPMVIQDYENSGGFDDSTDTAAAPAVEDPTGVSQMMDLMDTATGNPTQASSNSGDLLGNDIMNAAPVASGNTGVDLMSDLFGLGGEGAAPAESNDILQMEAQPPQPEQPSIVAYEKNGVRIVFALAKEFNVTETIVVTSKTTSAIPITNFVLQAAVPKSMSLTMLPPATPSNAIDNFTNLEIMQVMHVSRNDNSGPKKPLAVRLRVSFVDGNTGSQVVDEMIVKNFPNDY